MSSYTELIQNNSEGIFIISKNDCSLCEKLKELFDTIEVEYKTYLYEQENEIDDTIKMLTRDSTSVKPFGAICIYFFILYEIEFDMY